MASQRTPSRRFSRGTFLKGAVGLVGAAVALSAGDRSVQAAFAAAPAQVARPLVVYFGTGANGQGIHVYELDQTTGMLTARDLTPVAAPGWIDLDPTERFLYASVAESRIAGFAIDQASGRLTPLNSEQNGTNGAPHLSIDRTGRWVVTASYGGGTVSVLPIGSDGRLGEVVDVVQHSGEPGPHPNQTQPRAHQCPFDRSRRWITVPDLGLDRVYVYRLDPSSGKLIANDPPFVQVERGRGRSSTPE